MQIGEEGETSPLPPGVTKEWLEHRRRTLYSGHLMAQSFIIVPSDELT